VKKGHIPIRQCVGCRQRLAQRALTRYALDSNGRWQADRGLCLPGRGAYLCSARCAELVKKNKRYRSLVEASAPA